MNCSIKVRSLKSSDPITPCKLYGTCICLVLLEISHTCFMILCGSGERFSEGYGPLPHTISHMCTQTDIIIQSMPHLHKQDSISQIWDRDSQQVDTST